MIVRALFVPLVTAFLVQNVAAQSSLRAQRVQTPPAIDGRLDDAVWNAADTARGFRQIEPNEGAPETEPTELRVLYDNANLYVGVRLYDREPGKIVNRLSRRDDDADADSPRWQPLSRVCGPPAPRGQRRNSGRWDCAVAAPVPPHTDPPVD